ncbi:PHB depolymerase family esterase [Micromonospora sp. M12]
MSALQTYTRTWASYGWVDPVGNLSGDPVYVYHGGNDTSVRSPSPTTWSGTTSTSGPACSTTAAPRPATPGSPVRHARVHGDRLAVPQRLWCRPAERPPAQAARRGHRTEHRALGGTLVRFSQNTFAVNGWANGLSMGANGFAYVPSACGAGQSCRLLVALHGCAQSSGAVGTAFVDRANLNQYADTNNLIVLYPQAGTSLNNPNGCWDWWGYLGATNFPIKGGAQVETIMNMVRRLDG